MYYMRHNIFSHLYFVFIIQAIQLKYGLNGFLVGEVFLSKKVSEMTVKEFLEDAKKKGQTDVLEDQNFGLLQVLLTEGFTEEQASKMDMKKAYDLYLDSISNQSNKLFTEIYRDLEIFPEKAILIEPYVKKLKEELEKMAKDLATSDSNISLQ